jgi:hypothetical protein
MHHLLSALRSLRLRRRIAYPARRAHERAEALMPVDWHPFGSMVHGVSTTADVSAGGAFVCTARPMSPGSPVVLDLGLPAGRIEVHARVAWTDERGMGVRFTRRVAITT